MGGSRGYSSMRPALGLFSDSWIMVGTNQRLDLLDPITLCNDQSSSDDHGTATACGTILVA